MKSRFRHVALVGKYQTQGSGALLERIARLIADTGAEVSVEAGSAAGAPVHGFPTIELADVGLRCDLVVVVGGDGTMLSTARTIAGHEVPLVGINQGRLGFITDIALDTYETALPSILEGQYLEDHRSLLFGRVIRNDHEIFSALALNDVVISRGSTAGMIEVRVDVDGVFVVNQRADGFIVSSPTGSTAYALSAGGPILYPSISGWVLVPIASHTLTNRPIVLPDSGTLTLEIISGREASVNFDTQALASLRLKDRILLRRSRETVCFLHPPGWSFFETLRQKLHWNEGVGNSH